MSSVASPLRRNRDYTLLWVGQSLSGIGSSASFIAYPLLVLALTGSPARAGIVGAANWVPYVLFQLWAGALVDRWNKRTTLLVCTGLNAAAVSSVAAAYFAGILTFWQLVAVAFLDRTLTTFFSPAEISALGRVVPAAQLPEAVGRNDAREHIATLLGPPLGGALFGVSAAAPFVADAASYAASFAAASLLRTPLDPAPADEAAGRPRVLEGLRFIWNVPFLRASLLQAAGTNLTWSALNLTLVVVARDRGASGAKIGFMFALLGVGGLIGSAASRRLLARFSLPQIVLGSVWVWAALIAALVPIGDPIVLGAVAGGAFLVGPAWNGAVVGATMILTPEHLRGRVTAADALISFGTRPLGLLAVGYLDEAVSGRTAFAVIAGWTLLVAVASSFAPGLRRDPLARASLPASARP
jgi:MFS family permease